MLRPALRGGLHRQLRAEDGAPGRWEMRTAQTACWYTRAPVRRPCQRAARPASPRPWCWRHADLRHHRQAPSGRLRLRRGGSPDEIHTAQLTSQTWPAPLWLVVLADEGSLSGRKAPEQEPRAGPAAARGTAQQHMHDNVNAMGATISSSPAARWLKIGTGLQYLGC